MPTLEILYCSILLHFPLNHDQFSILHANTCQFYRFTFKILKLLNSLHVSANMAILRLKSSGGNCCYSATIVCVPSMRTYVVLGVLCSPLFSVVLCYIVASCCTFHSITISSPSYVQTLVSSTGSHLKF
jgi:hypothetical protein